jgi:hypothetical protein
MTFTLATFRDTIRWILTDATIWRDSMLNGWIKDAIRDYSNYFPLETSLKLDCTAATREYSLASAGEVLGVISVEYPDGQTPPRYLQRMVETHAIFWDHPYYDIRQGSTQYLVIGESPAAADDIIFRYLTLHTNPTSDSSTLTIPDEHLEALRLYVYWRALVHIALDQDIDVGRKSNIITSLGGTAKEAEYAYHYKLRGFTAPAPLTGLAGSWHMDADDRIY